MKCMSVLLAGLLICLVAVRPASAIAQQGQSQQRVEKIKANVMKRGAGESARVEVRLLDGSKLKGYIREANESSFVVVDKKTGAAQSVTYEQVDRVKGAGLSLGAKIGIGIGIAAAALITLALAALAYGGD